MIYKKGVRRPLVMGIQEVIRVSIDGDFGPITEQAVKDYQYGLGMEETGEVDQKLLDHMYKQGMQLTYRVLELIACFEVGFTRDAWSATSIVPGDGAGRNYGVMQVNKYGSMQIMKSRYMPKGEDFESWIGSGSGAKAQYRYFLEVIWSRATAFAYKVGDTTPRAIALFCDAIVQGGNTLPSKAPKTWKDWQLDGNYLELVKKCYEEDKVKSAFVKAIRAYERPSVAFAEIHPRSGNLRFLDDQLSRRRTVASGSGIVHGDKYDLGLFGIEDTIDGKRLCKCGN